MKLTNTMRDDFVNKVLNGLNNIDYISQVQELLNKDALSKLPKVLQGKDTQHYLEKKRIYFYDFGCMGAWYVRNTEYEASDEIKEKIKELHALFEAQREGKREAKSQLYAMIQSVTTLNRAKEVIPEDLHKFLPSENVPKVNEFALTTPELMSNLKSLGLKTEATPQGN
jgi:hypothetical protein